MIGTEMRATAKWPLGMAKNSKPAGTSAACAFGWACLSDPYQGVLAIRS